MTEHKDTPSLIQVVKAEVKAQVAAVYTAVPGVVVSFDAGPPAQATVCLGVQLKYVDADGAVKDVVHPRLAKVPVGFMGASGGGYSVTFPLAEGDECMLLIPDRSIDEWRANGGADQKCVDQRRHAITDAILLPIVTSTPGAIPADAQDGSALYLKMPASGAIWLGGDDLFVAQAEGTQARIRALEAALEGHTHPAGALLDSGGGACTGSTGGHSNGQNTSLDDVKLPSVKARST